MWNWIKAQFKRLRLCLSDLPDSENEDAFYTWNEDTFHPTRKEDK